MSGKIINLLSLSLLLIITGCASGVKREKGEDEKTPNFSFTVFDTGKNDPGTDRRSYYRLFIDKIEVGRTTTGLESQEKVFKSRLEKNRHLLSVEKWILDRKRGKYIKLNNINQPKPNYIYFTIPEKGKVFIILKTDPENRGDFSLTIKK